VIRVLHISARSDPGGGPAVITQIIENVGSPVEHHVASPADPPYGPRFAALVGPEHVVEIPHRRFHLDSWRRLANHIRRHDIHVLHSHGFGAGLYGRSLSVFLRVPVVHSYHGFLIPEHGWPGMLARYLVEAGLALVTTEGVVCSKSEYAKLRRLLPLSPPSLTVVNNGLSSLSGQTVPPPRPAPAPFTVLSIGRLAHQKNPEALIRIAAMLRRIEPELDFRFVLIGDGPRRDSAQQLARSLGIARRVEFLGTVQASDWLGQADVLLSASRGEGMPLSLLEAMAAGLPIVASGVVGNVDLVQEGETGFLFAPTDLEAAASTLAHLAKDPQLRGRLGANARQRARHEFTMERFAASCSAIYQRFAPCPAARMEEFTAP
jgi:glycosyltransferase involved in cell wall biosynthesis